MEINRKMRRIFITFALLAATAAVAQEQPRYTWVSRSCPNWNCAMLEMTWSQGDPAVIILSTTSKQHPWVILHRLDRNAAYVPPEDENFVVQRFDNVATAAATFGTLPPDRAPLLITTFDGSTIVTHLRVPEEEAGRKRSVRH